MPVHERTQAAVLGEGPLAMFDDGLPLKFIHGPQSTTGVGAMEFSSKHEDEWLSRATDAAITGARKIALGNGPLMNTPVGRLTGHEWGMIVTAVIFGWVEVRVQQAIAEGLDQEQTVRVTGLKPDPCDIAVVGSILPTLADKAAIDWSLPLRAWSKDTMTGFLMLTWELINQSEIARDHGSGTILRKAEFDEKTGDPIPF